MLSNALVKIVEENDRYNIYANETNIGYLTLNDSKVYIFIHPVYRGKHYATNALYLFVKYAHETLKIDKLYASINSDLSKHVFEHTGFHKEDGYYVHKAFKSLKDDNHSDENVIYLAGGCFWGMEKVFRSLQGVKDVSVGYVNGNTLNPTYEDVCRNNTGYKEAVKIIYNDESSLKRILEAYFICIDPTVKNRQGNDIGSQYQTGIYYVSDYETIKEFYDNKRKKYKEFYVEFEPFKVFYRAEEYHQNYLIKHPDGYCHITKKEMEEVGKLN